MIAIIVISMRKLSHLRLLITGTVVGLISLSVASASASSANISHSYTASGDIPNGSLVSLDSQQSNYVQLADSSNGPRLLGIAVASGDSLLAVDASTTKTQVATSGTANALVSTLNGNIGVGDLVGVSPFGGVGMKAMSGSSVIGLAQATFSAKTVGAQQRQIKDETGKTQQVWVGFVPVSLAVGTDTAPAGGAMLNSLQKIIKSLTGRTISTARIIISLGVAFIALVVLVAFIQASIYGGLISIGRNPLARHVLLRALVYITGMALLTTAVAGITIFFLLT